MIVKPRLSRQIQYTPAANTSCDVCQMPIVYSDKYNIDITKLYEMQIPKKKFKVQPLPSQPFLLDKPAQVFSTVKGGYIYMYVCYSCTYLNIMTKIAIYNYSYTVNTIYSCANLLLILDKLVYQPVEAIDASSIYNLFNFVCEPIRRVSVHVYTCVCMCPSMCVMFILVCSIKLTK